MEDQVCQFHVRRWVGYMLRESRERVEVMDELKRLMAELPLAGSRSLFELGKQVSGPRNGQVGKC